MDVHPDVFALGDAADIEHQPLPTTAEVAVQKARYLVRQLNAHPKTNDHNDYNDDPNPKTTTTTPLFSYTKKPLTTYLGNHDGISEGRSVDEPWSGTEAWLSWRSGSFYVDAHVADLDRCCGCGGREFFVGEGCGEDVMGWDSLRCGDE